MFVVYMIDTGSVYYTGFSSLNRLSNRLQEHINMIGSKYMERNHRDHPKKPVYVEILGHNCYTCGLEREKQIKALSHDDKTDLVFSDKNDLLMADVNFGRVRRILLKWDIMLTPKNKRWC